MSVLIPLLSQLVAVLAAAGLFSWLLLAGGDVVVGWIRRTSSNAPKPGSFSWSYAFAFVRTTLGWKDAVAMASAVALTFLGVLGASLAKQSGGDVASYVLLFKLAAIAALATFSALAAKQNIELLGDIKAKLLGQPSSRPKPADGIPGFP
jgi:hypothetical protein